MSAAEEPPAAPLRYACVALRDARGWVLMLERDEHPLLDPERWGFPGGAVEPGESDVEAARRELEEETGVVLAVADLHRIAGTAVRHEGRDHDDHCTLFTARTALAEHEIACYEGRRMVFVDPDVAGGLDLTTSGRLLLPALLAAPPA